MRQHGQNVPDPDPDGGGLKVVAPSGGAKGDDPAFKAAMLACQQYLPNGGTPPTMNPQQVDQMRRWAQCMREHGVDVSDPDPNNGGVEIHGGPAGGSKTDVFNDPAFKAADDACRSMLPKGGGK
jgi:hypothetical protein